MSREAGGYEFRAARRADLPLLKRWLESPEVVRWWGDPAAEAALLVEGLDEPAVAMRIVSFACGRPFAYAQDYDVHAWPQPHLATLPAGSRAIDAFIGEPELIGRGHGAAFLRVLALELLRAGAPLVAIDPAVQNVRARAAYRRAGFSAGTPVATAAGPAMLMLFEPGAAADRAVTPRACARRASNGGKRCKAQSGPGS
jgi:aminoglycoside 6'-N-acetyltransferase